MKIGATRRYQLSGFQEMDVVKIIRHEHYSPEPRFYNDIALLKLEKRIKIGKFYFINLKNKTALVTGGGKGSNMLYLSGIQTEKILTKEIISKVVSLVEKKASEIKNI